jgi:tRNA A37 N6-isopentenylltransferase MiaA
MSALMRHLRGEIDRDEAIAIGQTDTRHYARRQFTWFRHQLAEFHWIAPMRQGGWRRRLRLNRHSRRPALRADPESRDSGFVASRRPGMTPR